MSARPSRIYLVREAIENFDGSESKEILVRAKSKASAVALVASAVFKSELCSQDDLLRLSAAGQRPIEALESDE
jgi:hypothetical protein